MVINIYEGYWIGVNRSFSRIAICMFARHDADRMLQPALLMSEIFCNHKASIRKM
jgi:hypothetical protein